MPQFSPNIVKTAIAPITVRPSGLSCEAELFLGPDDLTKVATSGRIPFVSTGASQSVRLPITMPAQEGTYQGFIDAYAGGVPLLAYKATEEITIVEPYRELYVNGIAITACHGKKFIETGIDTDGIPYAVAESPLSAMTGLYIAYRNISASISYGVVFVLQYEPTWSVGYPCDQVPIYWRRCPGYVPQGDSEVCGVTGQSSWGYYCAGMYDALFYWAPADSYGNWWTMHYFRIKNILKCTSSGELPI